jgi:integrase
MYSTGRHARKTYLRMAQVLRELGDLGVASTADLTTATMALYVASKGEAANPNTVNGLLGSIAAACSYAVEEGWLDRPPAWRRVRLRGSPCVLNAPRSYGEVSQILGHLHARRESSWEALRIAALAWTVALTGLRLGEALHAWTADLDLAGVTLRVDPLRHRLKTEGSERTVPIPELLGVVLAEWLPHAAPGPWLFPGLRRKGPWTAGESGRSKAIDHLRRAASEAGISRITWHSLRHSFASSALERWDVPLWIVQRVMGHSDVRTTQRYLHTRSSPAIAAAMRSIGYRLPA